MGAIFSICNVFKTKHREVKMLFQGKHDIAELKFALV